MKQTNNAIKFLMAQYRSIFKNAYFKGLTTALVVTAGLAAAQGVQATATNIQDLTSGSKEYSGSLFQIIPESNTNITWNANITISNGSGAGLNGASNNMLFNSAYGDTTLSGSGSLVIKGSAASATGLVIVTNQPNNKTLTINIKSIEVQNSGSITVLDKSSNSGAVTIAADTINVGSGGAIGLTAAGGTTAGIVFGREASNNQGSVINIAKGGSIELASNSGQITIKGDELNVAGALKLKGNVATDSIAINSKNLTIASGGSMTTIQDTATANTTPYKISSENLTIDKGGTKTIGDGTNEVTEAFTGNQGNINGQVVVNKSGAWILKSAKTDDGVIGNVTFGPTYELQLGGKLEVTQGQLTIEDGAKLSATEAAASNSGSIVVGGGTADEIATLNISSDTLKAFLNSGDAYTDGTDKQGGVLISGGVINFTDDDGVDLYTLTQGTDKKITLDSGTAATANKLALNNATVKAADLKVSGQVAELATTSLEAETLTLGGAKDFHSTDTKTVSGTDLGFSKAIARNVVFTPDSGGATFTLRDDVILSSIEETDNPAEEFNTASTGAITGDVIVDGNGSLRVLAGQYTNTNSITLQSGKTLTVGGAESSDAAYGVDAILIQTGKLTLNGGSVEVYGNGTKTTIAATDETPELTQTGVVSLDLTGAALTLNGSSNSFDVADATVYVNGTQAQQILGQDTKTPTGSALVTLGKDGVLDVAGEIKGYNSTFIEVGAIGSKGKNIQFADKGATLRADEIWLKASKNNGKSVDNLVLGSGTINTDVLTVTTLTKSVSDNITYLPFNVSGGTLEIGQRLDFFGSINNDDGAFVLNDTDLNLGWRKVAADDSVTTSAAEGSVQQSLQLTNKSSLSVNYGSWRIGNVSLSGSSLSIGADSEKDKTLDYAVGVQGKALTLGTGSSAVVNENGTATFDSIELNKISSGIGNSLTVNKGGNLTTTTIALDKGNTRVNNSVYVEGQMTVVGDESDSHGIKFEEGSYIRVKGSDAKLTFDSDAVQNITVSGDTVSAGAFIKNFEIIDNGTLALNFNGETHFTEAAIKELRKALFIGSDGQYLAGRRIDLGAAILDGVTPTDGFLSWNDYQNGNKNGFQDIISDIQTDTLRNTTLTDVDANDVINLSVGNIKADADVAQVKLGSVTLSNASANDNSGNNFIFAADDPSKAIGAIITSDSAAVLENGGNIGAVTLEAGSDGKTTKFSVVSEDAATTIKGDLTAGANSLIDIKGVTNVEGNVSGDALTVDKALTANNITLSGALLSTGGDINVGEGDIKVGGNLTSPLDDSTAEGIAKDENGNFLKGGKLTANNLTVGGDMLYVGDIEVKGTTTLNGTSHGFVDGNNTFGDLVLNRRLFVGSQAGKDASAYKTTVNGTLTINNPVNGAGESDLDIEGAILSAGLIQGKKLDEAGNLTAAPFFVEVGTDAPADDGDYAASTGYLMADRVDLQGGTIRVDPTYSMPASIVTVNTFGDKAIALDGKDAGTLDGNLVTLQNSILAVGLERTKGEQDGIAQVKALFKDYFAESGALNYAADKDNSIGSILYVAKALNVKEGSKLVVDATRSHHTFNSDSFTDHEIYLGDKSALAINASAGQQEGKAAINFAESGASIYSDGGKIVVVVDDSFNPNSQEIQLFADGDTEEGTKGVDIASDSKTILVETLNGLFIQEFTYDADAEDPNANAISSVKLEYTPEAETKAFANASDPVSKTLSTYAQMTLPDGATGNALLNRVRAGNDTTAGRDAEVVARLGAFGGAAQAAIAAGSTTYEAVSGRMGVGATGANITVADNTQGAALWLSPVYKNRDSDGFGAQGLDYGTDLDLYGVALGADYTLANGFKIGAAFNIGSGDADGNGAGEGVSNDFDYYGFAIYGGYTYGPYSVVADISYTNVDNDVEASTSVPSVGKVGTSFDSSNLSVGVTAQYQALLDGDVTVTPHAGLRYTKIDLDDYTVHGENGDVAAYSSDDMSIFSIPFGVTVAKEFVNGTWTVKPSFDLTLTANMGDDSADGSVNWGVTGLENTAVASEVLDNFTYGATVGVAAKSGNFSLGFGLNYTGSSNTDEFGVNANARFVF